MQGRLTERVDNKIQAFPEKNWEKEFKIAKKINLKIIEWTIDYKNFYKNPLLTSKGQKKNISTQKKIFYQNSVNHRRLFHAKTFLED